MAPLLGVMKIYTIHETLVLPAEVTKPGHVFTEVKAEGISGSLLVLSKYIFDTELEALKVALDQAETRASVHKRRIKELEAAA